MARSSRLNHDRGAFNGEWLPEAESWLAAASKASDASPKCIRIKQKLVRPRLPPPGPPSSPQARSPSYWTRFRTRLNFSTRTTSTQLQTPRPLSARWNWRSIIIIITITTIIITITTITIITTTTTTTTTTIDGRPGAADGPGLPSVV
jgi:hypothetical protein